MKKVALLTVLLVVAASAAITITFPGGDPTTVGVPVRVIITSGSATEVDLFVNPDTKQWVYPTEVYLGDDFVFDSLIEITHPGTGVRLFASKGAETGESEPFDVVEGDPNRWQIIAPGEVPDSGLATDTTGKHGSASVTAGDPENYTINICDKWWNPVTGSQTPSLETTDPFGHLPATPVVGANSIELRTAGSRYVKVYGGGLTLADSSKVTVEAGTVEHLLMLCPEESWVPGDDSTDNYLPGKENDAADAFLGTPYTVNVWAVDKCWNLVNNYTATDVTILDDDNADLTDWTTDAFPIQNGKAEVKILFKGVNISPGEYISARDSEGELSKYPTPVIVKPGVDSLYAYLNPTIVPIEVHSTLHAEAYVAGKPVGAGSSIMIELIDGPAESFHIADDNWIIETNSSGIAETEVWADAETTYTIRVTAGEQTKDLTLTIKELTELLVAPNPFKSGSPGHDEIKFMYKVAQAGAAEVLLLIADPYGNIVYKETHTSGEVVSPGTQEISWDGKNSKGNMVASGMYQAVVKITLTNLSTEVLKKNFMVIW